MTIPSLPDVLYKENKSPYTKSNFLKYLSSIHCIENYEFINDVNKYNKLKDKEKLIKWNEIIKLYLCNDSPKEINLPYQYKQNLLVKTPNPEVIKKAYRIIFELLSDSYNQFITVTKKQTTIQNQSLPIPATRRSSISSSGSRRNSVIEVSSRRGLSNSNVPSGFFGRSNSITANSIATNSGSRINSRRPSLTPEYPKSPINNGTTGASIKANIVKIPSPISDVDSKKKSNPGLFKKFKFRT